MNYARARITFRTQRLDDTVYDRLKAIPGVYPWEPFGHRTAWTAPYTAAWVVQRVLERNAVPYVVDVPAVDPLANFGDPGIVSTLSEQVRTTALARGVHEWVLTDWIKPFQLMCAAWATDRKRSFVRAEPGAGKTAIAILAAACIGLPVIVVTRDSVVTQYAREWRRLTTWDVLERRSESRMRKRDERFEDYCERMRGWWHDGGASDRGERTPPVVVLGWSMLATWVDSLIVGVGSIAPHGMLVIFDESQNAKGRKRRKWSEGADGKLGSTSLENTTAAADKLARAAEAVLLTSATPVANAVIDLWGQYELVEPGAWGYQQSSKAFAFRYCNGHQGQFGGYVVTGINEAMMPELNARLSFSTITIPYDVSHGQLPPKRRMLVYVAVEDQIDELAGMGRELRRAQKEAASGANEAVVRMHRLELVRAASRKRRAVVMDVLERLQTGKGKVLLFSGTRRDCEDLAERLRKDGDGYGADGGPLQVWCSHGEDDRDDRDEIKDAYMAHPGPCVLVGTWQAWGEGLNLDDTDVLGFVMLPYTPREIAQGEGRGDRISMNRPLLIVYYVAEGTADEPTIDRVLAKVKQVAQVSGGQSRLDAFGGIASTLSGTDRIDEKLDAMYERGEPDDLDALFKE